MSATMNGRAAAPRKQLADQIDRLDAILDGLADALNGAVADAAREGVRAAVAEALASPELRALLARPAQAEPAETAVPQAPTPAAIAPSRWARLKSRLGAWRRQLVEAARPTVAAAAAKCREAKPVVTAGVRVVGLAWAARRALLAGLGFGLVTALACYVAPRAVSAVIGGAGGACAALALQGGLWVRATAKKMGVI